MKPVLGKLEGEDLLPAQRNSCQCSHQNGSVDLDAIEVYEYIHSLYLFEARSLTKSLASWSLRPNSSSLARSRTSCPSPKAIRTRK